MLLRDRLLRRLAEMGDEPDYVSLAAEVLGIRNAPPALARKLVDQALVVEDRREAWLRTGERVCAAAPSAPGVYVLRADDGRAIYVGKANDIRRRLRTHFAARRWRAIKPALARVADVTWQVVGSEIEALVLEARWIHELAPPANVQVGEPALDSRALPASVVGDTLLVLPSADDARAVLLATRVSGQVAMDAVGRDGVGVTAAAARVMRFFKQEEARAGDGPRLAPLVFTWLAGRGAASTRLDPHDAGSAKELGKRLSVIFRDSSLFAERIVVVRSVVLSTSTRP